MHLRVPKVFEKESELGEFAQSLPLPSECLVLHFPPLYFLISILTRLLAAILEARLVATLSWCSCRRDVNISRGPSHASSLPKR